ncbi:MAG TPA: PAS domain S-box protein [Blastocatellia bacterium]|nr:PAS domain S-box protein [Blastocatellia bacterium]
MKEEPSALLRYSLPVLANALALLATTLLGPATQETRAPFFFAAVAVCTWYGGIGPGILAIILAVLSLRLFLLSSQAPVNPVWDAVTLGIFALASLLIAYLQVGRKRAERAALEKQKSLDLIVATVPSLVTLVDSKGRIILFNQACEELTGYTQNEVAGKPVVDVLVPPEFAHEVKKRFAPPYPCGSFTPCEDPWVTKAGEVRLIEWRYAALDSPSGETLILGAGIDITERRRKEEQQRLAEEQLANENEFRKAIEQSMRAGVAVIDLEGRQTYANRAFCEMVGWSEEELLGAMPPYPYWAPEELDNIQKAFRETIAGRSSPSGFELLFRRRNEERFYAVVLASPLKNARGEISGWLASVYDLTERKRIEQERELLLAREQRAREEAELAYRARDEFIAMVSHELRNPLNSLLGWLHIVRTRRLDEAATAHAIEAIENNARMQARLINDLLDLSRISSGKLHLTIADLDLAQVVETAIQQMRPSADEKNISIETSLESSLVLGDSDRLTQAVQNLLSNAIKFTPRGGVITVRLQRHAASAQISIKDTGTGIDPSLLPHIFDKFRQGEPGRQRGGLGLGLTIVRDLVEMHGGSVHAESGGEGRGSIFTIMLPLSPDTEC